MVFLDGVPTSFADAVNHLADGEGNEALLMVTSPTEDGPVLLRLTGVLGKLDQVTEHAAEPGEVDHAVGVRVGEALITLHPRHVVEVLYCDAPGWVILKLDYAWVEFRGVLA